MLFFVTMLDVIRFLLGSCQTNKKMEQVRIKGKFSTLKKVEKHCKVFYNLNITTGNVLPSCHTVDLCDFDTSTKAAGSTPCSFDSINNDLFAGQMKPLRFCCFVVDLKIFLTT